MLVKEAGDLEERLTPLLSDPFGKNARGHVHAVQDVADVVQHVARVLGFARHARRLDETPMQLSELLLCAAALGDVVHDRGEQSLFAEVDLAEREPHRKRATVLAAPVDLS